MITIPSSLGIGPMSKEIVEMVYRYSAEQQVPLMLICSKNQVDFDSGYTATTQSFRHMCQGFIHRYPQAKVLLCRDHCGPGFNGHDEIENVYQTIDADLANNFDLIHVDFSSMKTDNATILAESKKAIEYILSNKPATLIEIGTEENSGLDFQNLQKVSAEMEYFRSFCAPTFFVCQTGSLVKEMHQAGSFDPEYAWKLYVISQKYGLAIKEHNADYLSASEVRLRRGLIGAMNIAPQLGVAQTLFTLQKASIYGIKTDNFIEKSYLSKKWQKWLLHRNETDQYYCSIIAGHYCFRTPEYEKIIEQLSWCENFAENLQQELLRLIDLYITNLSAANTK